MSYPSQKSRSFNHNSPVAKLNCLIWVLVMVATVSETAFARIESADVTLDYVAKKAEARAREPFHFTERRCARCASKRYRNSRL